MDEQLKGMLERAFLNSSRFLWSISKRNQKETYPWLRAQGKKLWGKDFDFNNKTYGDVQLQLLKNPGIEKLILDLVIPEIKTQFSEGALEYLRVSWNSGTLPAMSGVKRHNVYDPYPFLEYNAQYEYIERWGEWAFLFFEILEPWLKRMLPGTK